MTRSTLVVFLVTASMSMAATHATAAENLIRDGDFERAFTDLSDITESWNLWGAGEGKIWTNFTRDTTNPHGGAACLRAHRPAHAGSWFSVLVTTPNKNYISPTPGRTYTLTFWARSEIPGSTTLRVGSYKTVDPYENGPTLKSFTFETGAAWKRYSVSFCEGTDFFASQAKYTYLGFFLAGSREERTKPRTVWFDDVSVTEEPGPEGARGMVDPGSLDVPKVPFRLERGDDIDVTVDVSKTVRATNLMAGGVAMVSLGRWMRTPFSREGTYNLNPSVEQAFKDLKLPWTRFYGLVHDEPFDTIEESLDAVVLLLDKLEIPHETTMLELENLLANDTLPPETWARAVKYSLDKGYGFRYWEIGNEIYAMMWGSHGKAFPNPDVYIEHFLAVSKAIREVQPDALIGLSIPRGSHKWGNYVMNATKGQYDYVCPHFYGGFGNISKTKFEDLVIAENHQRLDSIQQMNALLKAYDTGRCPYIYDSEWGLHASTPDGKHADQQPKNASILGTVYRAVRMLYYAREDLIHGACGWKSLTRTRTPGFAVLYYDKPETRSMLYWLYYYFNRGLGERVVDISGTVPYYTSEEKKNTNPLTPVMATANEEGDHVYLMLVNGSWAKDVPASVKLPGFDIDRHQAVLLSHDDIDAYPHLEKKSDFVHDLDVNVGDAQIEFTMPAHSIAFIELWKAAKKAPVATDVAATKAPSVTTDTATPAAGDARSDATAAEKPTQGKENEPAATDASAPDNTALLIGVGAVLLIAVIFAATRLAGGTRRKRRNGSSGRGHRG